jgi:hypothetical protein
LIAVVHGAGRWLVVMILAYGRRKTYPEGGTILEKDFNFQGWSRSSTWFIVRLLFRFGAAGLFFRAQFRDWDHLSQIPVNLGHENEGINNFSLNFNYDWVGNVRLRRSYVLTSRMQVSPCSYGLLHGCIRAYISQHLKWWSKSFQGSEFKMLEAGLVGWTASRRSRDPELGLINTARSTQSSKCNEKNRCNERVANEIYLERKNILKMHTKTNNQIVEFST